MINLMLGKLYKKNLITKQQLDLIKSKNLNNDEILEFLLRLKSKEKYKSNNLLLKKQKQIPKSLKSGLKPFSNIIDFFEYKNPNILYLVLVPDFPEWFDNSFSKLTVYRTSTDKKILHGWVNHLCNEIKENINGILENYKFEFIISDYCKFSKKRYIGIRIKAFYKTDLIYNER